MLDREPSSCLISYIRATAEMRLAGLLKSLIQNPDIEDASHPGNVDFPGAAAT